MNFLTRAIAITFILVLMLLAFVAGPSRQKSSTVYAEPAASAEIALVARDLVDIIWDTENYPPLGNQFVRWDLFRGTAPDSLSKIASGQSLTPRHYRDSGLAQGITYHYRLDFVHCYLTCEPHQTVTQTKLLDSVMTGVFQGEVHHDLTLGPGIYSIGFGDVGSSASVKVVEGAKLIIGAGTTVQMAPSLVRGTLTADGGRMEIDLATFKQVSLNFGDYYKPTTAGGGWVKKATMEPSDTGIIAVTINGLSDITVEDNTGTFNVIANHQAKLRTHKNTMNGSIELNEQATATISNNSITDGKIDVSGYGAQENPKAYALITENEIVSAYKGNGIVVSYGARVNAFDNEIRYTGFHDSESSILLSAWYEDTLLTAERNLIQNGKVFVSYGPALTLADNVIKGGGGAITVGCLFCGSGIQATGSIERNTVQEAWGLEMWAGSHALSIRHNCIRGNHPGLETADATMSTPVDVQYNWWGHPSGPSHESSPGFGDLIVGNMSNFSNWDTAGTYCRDNPPPPIKPDLKVEEVKMVQVVEGVDLLVEAKPLVVKAVISSNESLSDPVKVILRYAGKTYDEFYLAEAGNLAPDLTFKAASTGVDFIWPESKTIYFFPELAPFGGSATATVEVDHDDNYEESNELNNLLPMTQPVVKTYWGADPGDQAFRAHYFFQRNYFIRNVKNLHKAAALAQDLSSLIPIAPIDYYGTVDLNESLDSDCRPTDVTLAELVKREHRKLKSANPDHLRYTLIPSSSWWSPIYCPGRYLPGTAGYGYWFPKGTPEMIFSSINSFNFMPGIIAESFGVPTDSNFNPVHGGVHVRLARLVDDTLARNILKSHARSYLGNRTATGAYWYDDTDYLVFLTSRAVLDTVPDQAPARMVASGDLLLVSGTVADDGSAALDPIFKLSAGVANLPSAGLYTIKFLDGSDGLLFSHTFDLEFTVQAEDGPLALDETSFSFGLPYHAGIARVVVEKEGLVLDSVTVSANTPTVAVTYPNGGESLSGTKVVTWNGHDGDSDDLTYAVLYSNDDGLNWRTLAMDLTTASFSWDTEKYPGADGSGRIKVMVSDGFHTAEDISDGAFSVSNKAPGAGIVNPFDGAIFTQGLPAVFEGAGIDLEEGWLDGVDLSWESDRDGAIGSGDVVSPMLSLGQHVIQLTAEDEHGLSGTDQITVTVSTESQPDLSIVPGSLVFGQSTAPPGPAWLAADILNVVADVEATLSIYRGDPSHGGTLIGQTLILAGANTVTRTGIDWLPLYSEAVKIYAVIEDAKPLESNIANNQATIEVDLVEGGLKTSLPLILRK